MRFFVCTTDADPCPVSDQAWITTTEVVDPAQFGITPETILKATAWGFGVVLMGFLIGYAIGVATGLIKRV